MTEVVEEVVFVDVHDSHRRVLQMGFQPVRTDDDARALCQALTSGVPRRAGPARSSPRPRG